MGLLGWQGAGQAAGLSRAAQEEAVRMRALLQESGILRQECTPQSPR